MRHKLVCESLLEYAEVSSAETRYVALNIIKQYKEEIKKALIKTIEDSSDNFKSLSYEEYFEREFDGVKIYLENDELSKSLIKDNHFIIDAKVIGYNEGGSYIFEAQSLGIYFTSPNGEGVAEFYDKDELTETNTFITFVANV